ncbi:MAG: hypothetical protein P8N62_03670 [Alphaproteobacteria bacterium]|nr:hypothetical protein [Alphaproteobacteria bacterium]
MKMDAVDRAVWHNILILARLTFSDEGYESLLGAPIVFCSLTNTSDEGEKPAILIPIDSDDITLEKGWWRVDFGSTHLHCHSLLPCPEGWHGMPNNKTPAWWVSPKGSLTPAWNFFAIIRGLYLFKEERDSDQRDKHGRFPIEASPRFHSNLTHVPFINDVVALIIDAALHLQTEDHSLLEGVSDVVLPPVVVLSHDLDNLTGNSFWTQAGRLHTFIKTALRFDLSAFRHLGFIFQNILSPEKYYFEDQIRMWEEEKKYGFSSVAYILNGLEGRFGARTPFKVSKRLYEQAPKEVEFGIHYNYGVLNTKNGLAKQKAEIDAILQNPCTSGRAHYLKFNAQEDFLTLIKEGIDFDESLGWPYQNSYYCGIAGPFAPICPDSGETLEIIEFPMVFMDNDLPREDGTPSCFSAMLEHICQVGGCLSILVHPGASHNPERLDMEGVYERILADLGARGVRSLTPQDLKQKFLN